MDSYALILLMGGAVIMLLSIFSSKISTKFGFPTILVFIAIGMLVSKDGIGSISFKNVTAAQIIGNVTLSFVLFSGGLDTHYKHIKPIIWNGVLLSTFGVIITASVVGLFVSYVTNFSFIEGLLVGAIVSSTDAAAVFSILKSRNLYLKHNLAPTLELESGSNDAMAFMVTVLLTMMLGSNIDITPFYVFKFFVKEIFLGGAAGLLMGKAILWIINRIRLAYEALYPALVLALIIFTFSFVNYIHGNGYLAIYIVGIILGNSDFIHKKSLIKFYEGIHPFFKILPHILLLSKICVTRTHILSSSKLLPQPSPYQ